MATNRSTKPTRAAPARRPVKPVKAAPAAAVDEDADVDLDLDVVAKEAARTPFTFRLGGEVFTLSHFEDADIGWVLDGSEGSDLQMMRGAILAAFADDADYARFRRHRLSMAQLNSLFDRWQAHAGLTPGESGASSGS